MKYIAVILFLFPVLVYSQQRTNITKGLQRCLDAGIPVENCFITTNALGEQIYVDSATMAELLGVTSAAIPLGCGVEKHQDFNGDGVANEFEVTNFGLIDASAFTIDQVESKYIVDRNGLILRYDPTPDGIDEYSIDFASQEIEVDPDFIPSASDNISITEINYEFFEEFVGDDVSFEFNLTNCGLIDDDLFNENQIETNLLVDRNGLIMRYDPTPTGIAEYTIDFANQEIELDSDFPLLVTDYLGVRN